MNGLAQDELRAGALYLFEGAHFIEETGFAVSFLRGSDPE
jgi:hypothetical protein